MNVYVAYFQKDGKRGWLENPKLFFDGHVLLVFSLTGITVGVNTSLLKAGLRGAKKLLVDELDKLGVPWTGTKNARVETRALGKTLHDLYLMDINITGPLPYELASRIKGVRKAKFPVKVMIRYGG